ncbi:MAG: FAD-binding protein [Desulfobacteraceae bacterium]|nr:FAD-binding protein [Desulfobacteraceae bacterium]
MAGNHHWVDRVVETDVLVVGGGAAGTMAAVAAAQEGCRVAMVVKGSLGRSGNTIMAMATFRADGESAAECGEKKADPKYTKDVLFENIIKDGFYLSDQNLVRQYVADAGKRISQFLGWLRQKKQRVIFMPPGVWLTSGKAVGMACRYGVRQESNVDVHGDILIHELLEKDGRIVGALGVKIYTGELIAFKARSVVLSSGGFEPYSFKCSHSDMTGDGPAMAFRAGAELADMEFLLQMPGALLRPLVHRGSILPFVLNVGRLISPGIMNTAGEDIRKKIPPDLRDMAQGSEWMKLIYSYYWAMEISAGKATADHGLYFDFSASSRLRQSPGAIKAFILLKLLYRNRWQFQGKDIRDLFRTAKEGGRWEVGLSNQYAFGGIVVDNHMSSNLPGLYAAGEAASGVFGANRVASALTEAIVQGHRAGRSAAAYAAHSSDAQIDNNQLAAAAENILRFFRNTNGRSAAGVRSAMEKAADTGFGLIRDDSGLNLSLEKVISLRQMDLPEVSLRNQARAYNLEWFQALQTENLLTCVEIGMRSALLRKESRGFHVRTDFPRVDNENWAQRIYCRKQGGEITLSKHAPSTDHLAVPMDRWNDVMAYAAFRQKEMADRSKGKERP